MNELHAFFPYDKQKVNKYIELLPFGLQLQAPPELVLTPNKRHCEYLAIRSLKIIRLKFKKSKIFTGEIPSILIAAFSINSDLKFSVATKHGDFVAIVQTA